MPSVAKEPWWVWGKSVLGADHGRDQKPLQDACEYLCEHDFCILAVADGHGSDKSPYSDIGAQVAVRITCDVLAQFYKDLFKTQEKVHFQNVYRMAREWLPRVLVRDWRNQIAERYKAQFPDKEPINPNNTSSEVWKLYGTTLLAVLVTSEMLILLQIGDGDILVVDENGGVLSPVPQDPRLLGVEVTSLSGKNAENDFRIPAPIIIDPSKKNLVMVCTDGYTNSFSTEHGLYKAGTDYLNILNNHGTDYLIEHLPGWLERTSDAGSGDDITVGFILLGQTTDDPSDDHNSGETQYDNPTGEG